tara:strand:- start:3012 stop:4226 length:1215 start_codon:yes stop_codon:yes gene_type:complete
MKKTSIKPCIVGLGYVGLPLFLKLQNKMCTIGYDNDNIRIRDLKIGLDINKEFTKKDLILNKKSYFSSKLKDLKKGNFYIVAVPTPINNNFKPNLNYLKQCCILLGKSLKKKDIVFFESTVYPGVTENICAKILEDKSGLKFNKDFFVGYSPERINPGDKKHSVDKISKIVSIKGSENLKIAKKVYGGVTKKISFTNNIKEAESAKVIENIQRDLNIGLMNEIYKVCYKSNINFSNVIKLASTKWNFLKFDPGLVGGHCLPVDPYYYSDFAKKKGIKTDVILSGRKINNSMYLFMYNKIIKEIKNLKLNLKKTKILVLGLTYKKNVSDVRNSFALKLFKLLKKKVMNLDVCDPLLIKKNIKNVKVLNNFNLDDYELILNFVNHDVFKDKILKIKKTNIKYLDLF